MNVENFKLEQYKQLLSQLAALHSARETSNQFWVIVNTVGLTAVSYIKELNQHGGFKVEATVLILFILGIALGILWIVNLLSFKKNMNGLYNRIQDFEIHYNSIVFAKTYKKRLAGVAIRFPATVSEICVPICFIISYMLLGGVLVI